MGRQFKLQHVDNSSLATVLVLTKSSFFIHVMRGFRVEKVYPRHWVELYKFFMLSESIKAS